LIEFSLRARICTSRISAYRVPANQVESHATNSSVLEPAHGAIDDEVTLFDVEARFFERSSGEISSRTGYDLKAF